MTNTNWDAFRQINNTTPTEFERTFSCAYCDTPADAFITDYRHGYEVCPTCGKIQHGIIDKSAEWRIKGNAFFSSNPQHCGIINPLLPNSSLSTTIASKKGYRSQESYMIAKLNKWQSMPSNERSLYKVFSNLDNKCQDTGISTSILLTAKVLYKKIYNKNTELLQNGKKRKGLRGPNRQGLIGACLYFACKMHNVPRSRDHIADVMNISQGTLTKGINIFLDLMKHENITKDVTELTNSKDYIKQYCIILDAPFVFQKYALDFCKYAKSIGALDSNTPRSIAAGCLYTVCAELKSNINEYTIEKYCGISKVTILHVYNHIAPFKNQILVRLFIQDFCYELHINDLLIKAKIIETADILAVLPGLRKFSSMHLAGMSVYFVIYFASLLHKYPKQQILKICHITEPKLIEIYRNFYFYKNIILSTVIEPFTLNPRKL